MDRTDKEGGQVILFADASEMGEVGRVKIGLFEPSVGIIFRITLGVVGLT